MLINFTACFRPLFAMTFLVLLAACSASKPTVSFQQQMQTREALLNVYHRWQGVPYRLGGTSLNGVDCSAFVQVAANKAMQIQLPRTTELQVEVGVEVDYDDMAIGDLVFFKTSLFTRHVGVYIGDKQFLHASTSKGVIISRLDNPYWADKFWQARRVTTHLSY